MRRPTFDPPPFLHPRPRVPTRGRAAAFAALLAAIAPARADEGSAADAPVAGAVASDAPTAPRPQWEGAIGLTASYRPEYAGSSRQVAKVSPALFLRWGRLTITNASGFVTRRSDDVVRGLGLDMVSGQTLRVNLALRFDAGRSEGTSDALRGMGDIQPTVRARLQASWRLPGPWRLGVSWSADALGRGGGNFGDVSGGWEQRIAPHTTATLGTALSVAGDRYLQTYYGVSAEQSARSGYAVYEPRAGLRDVSVYANLRHDLGHDWTLLAGASATRLLGPAARSPLTTQAGNWGISAGAAWRF